MLPFHYQQQQQHPNNAKFNNIWCCFWLHRCYFVYPNIYTYKHIHTHAHTYICVCLGWLRNRPKLIHKRPLVELFAHLFHCCCCCCSCLVFFLAGLRSGVPSLYLPLPLPQKFNLFPADDVGFRGLNLNNFYQSQKKQTRLQNMGGLCSAKNTTILICL